MLKSATLFEGALVYYIRRCMHDWSDDNNAKILSHLADAIRPASDLRRMDPGQGSRRPDRGLVAGAGLGRCGRARRGEGRTARRCGREARTRGTKEETQSHHPLVSVSTMRRDFDSDQCRNEPVLWPGYHPIQTSLSISSTHLVEPTGQGDECRGHPHAG